MLGLLLESAETFQEHAWDSEREMKKPTGSEVPDGGSVC
jgi:hypothetical protein